MKLASLLSLCALAGLLLTGCAAQQPRRIVAGGTQAITTMNIDLQDFKNAASQLTQAMLNNRTLLNFEAQNGRPPTVKVGQITNKSDRPVDLAQIAGRINEDLLNSGLVEIIADDAGAVAASEEDAFETFESVNRDHQADFYLEGTINMLTAYFDGQSEKTYTFQLRLHSRDRRTIFQKSVDIAKQGDRASAVGW
jgi:PBP1b-binding outer membrane lipoprotein LpoB